MADKFTTLTVEELIEALQAWPGDTKVIFSTDYGDYHHTAQALPIRGEVDTATIARTAYSNSGWAIDQTGSDENGDFDAPVTEASEAYLVIR